MQAETNPKAAAEVISISDGRADLENKVPAVLKGWKELTDTQRRSALRRLLQQFLIGPRGLDIYYYTNSNHSERSSGSVSNEEERDAEVIWLQSRGAFSSDCKLQVAYLVNW